MKRIIYITLILTLTGCVSRSYVYRNYNKGGHPIGRNKYKVKGWERRYAK